MKVHLLEQIRYLVGMLTARVAVTLETVVLLQFAENLSTRKKSVEESSRHITEKKNVRLDNKHIKSCSTSLVIIKI